MRNYKDALDKAQESVESAQSKLESTQDNYDNYTITALSPAGDHKEL